MEWSVTLVLVLANVGISLLAFSNNDLYSKLMFNPYMVHHHREWIRLPGHAFVHADYIHLFFNMYVLYQFGGLVEDIFTDPEIFGRLFPSLEFWGRTRGLLYYILLYVGGLLFATLPAFQKHKDNPAYNAVGASGAVSAVVLAIILLLPTMNLYLFFIPIGIPAFALGIVYLVYEYFMSKRSRTGIAHDAHLWGGLFGLLFMLVINYKFALYFFARITDYIGW